MQNSGIYCIENLINNKKYIGQSIDMHARWHKHKSALNRHAHDNEYLQRSWDKYGEDNFKFYVIEFCSIDCLDEKEIYYIDFYNTLSRDNGYNLMSGGTFGRKYSIESCLKKSRSLMGHKVSNYTRMRISENHADCSGENNGMYGRHHTEESKIKISMATKGRISSKRNLNNVYCIELDRIFNDATEAAKQLNIDSSAILKCCRGERKTCGGYHWNFINLENNIS